MNQSGGTQKTTGDPARILSANRIGRLRVQHLRLLGAIHYGGSLGSAARSLGISQPAVTVLLQELEAVFRARLVHRDARGARLTLAGEVARERLAIALAALDRAIEAAGASKPETVLRLGCVQVAGVSVLPAAIGRLEKSAALYRLRIQEGRANELLAALREGELDCVVGWVDESEAGALAAEELLIEPLWRGEMQVVASRRHPLARSGVTSVAELARWRWIVPPPGSRTHAAYLRLFQQEGIPAPPVAVECGALHTMLRIVGATQLLAVAPDAAVRCYEKLHTVLPLKGRHLNLGRNPVSIVSRKDSESIEAVRALRQALVDAATSA